MRVRADAVHPGYGFLSENADFAQACLDAGLDVRRTAAGRDPRHGLEERLQGRDGGGRACRWRRAITAPTNRPQRLAAEAQRVGLPAHHQGERGRRRQGHAGGALRGRSGRRGANPRSAWRAPPSATTGCCSSAIFRPARHVEVQVFADSHGGMVGALRPRLLGAAPPSEDHRGGARAGPAPREVRAAMAQAAMTAARAVGYVGRGHRRVPGRSGAAFLFHGDEYAPAGRASGHGADHRASTWSSGSCSVARGEPLAGETRAMQPHGAAIEARLYAEDPAHDYLPSVGRIAHLRWPALGSRSAPRYRGRGGR